MKELRIVLYARVACETPQAETVIMSQMEILRRYAADSGMKVVEEITDVGYSGLGLDRPGLGRIRDLAERRAFDVLLVSAPDRLGRNATLVSSLVRELEQTGVKTLFVVNR